MTTYCEVALTVPLRTTFTYELPESLVGVIESGSRVAVPFRNKVMVGVVLELADNPPDFAHEKSALVKIKKVSRALDSIPALPRTLIELGRWAGSYYLATPGDVFRAMLPPLTELRAERVLRITPEGIDHLAELKAMQNRSEEEITEHALLELIDIEAAPLAAKRLRKLPGGEDAAARLLRHGYLQAEEIHKSRKTRTQKIIAWNPAHVSTMPITSVQLPKSDRAAAKKMARNADAAEERVRHVLAEESGPLPLKLLLERAAASRAVVDHMLREAKLTSWEEAAIPDEEDFFDAGYTAPANILNAEQEHAFSELRSWLDRGEFTVGLLHGVTGSGKTEVYLRAVAEALRHGKTAIVLVPEIALTLWVGRIFRASFGEQVAVLHSALPDAERSREWWRVRRGEAKIIVGTRSAVFAPAANLGLIIVDEEHEASYKQEESPRYHARDTAVMRAKLENAAVLLGSATPSLESYQHAKEGKYTLLRLDSRVANREMAHVEVVDMRQEFKKTHRATAISSRLREAIAERLVTGAQSLILINRRGYSWLAMCRSCGASVQCENCSISLTYHKKRQRMVCHYCGFSTAVVKKCPKCDSEYVYFFGEGAERLEESLRELFPQARIGRLDRDTVRTKREYQKVLGAFAAGKLDILVGTQMVAKGHDFQRVTLVGVISADLRLGMPDFRAAERTFQLLTQVAGRAGRGDLIGEVFVESFYPEHYAIQDAARQDFEAFFEREVRFRRLMHYPPFAALANVLVRDRKIENAIRWSRQLGEYFAPFEKRGVRVLGPAAAPLSRLKSEHRFQFLLKSPSRASLHEALAGCLDFCVKKQIPETAIVLDVDPLSLF